MRTIARTAALCSLSLCLGACEKAPKTQGPPAPTVAAPLPAAPLGSGLPVHAPAGGPSVHAPAGGEGLAVTGKVLETMDSGGYTYVKLATGAREQWAAVQQDKVAVGDTVTITNAMVMTNFESKTLGRTFDEILFGSLGRGAPGAAAANPHGGGAVAAPAAPPAKGAVTVDTPIAKADGPTGRTVAEVFAQKATLTDKPVVVRGKVTKFSADIMGKNWVHVQDGTGDPTKSEHDLTVTTSAVATVGDVVVVKGVVRTNKDFGAGYFYAVIVEDATVEK